MSKDGTLRPDEHAQPSRDPAASETSSAEESVDADARGESSVRGATAAEDDEKNKTATISDKKKDKSATVSNDKKNKAATMSNDKKSTVPNVFADKKNYTTTTTTTDKGTAVTPASGDGAGPSETKKWYQRLTKKDTPAPVVAAPTISDEEALVKQQMWDIRMRAAAMERAHRESQWLSRPSPEIQELGRSGWRQQRRDRRERRARARSLNSEEEDAGCCGFL